MSLTVLAFCLIGDSFPPLGRLSCGPPEIVRTDFGWDSPHPGQLNTFSEYGSSSLISQQLGREGNPSDKYHRGVSLRSSGQVGLQREDPTKAPELERTVHTSLADHDPYDSQPT